MKKIFFYFAMTGWTLGLIVTLLTLWDIDVQTRFHFVWILHIGVLLVWIPVILILRKQRNSLKTGKTEEIKTSSPTNTLSSLFRNAPTWLTSIAVTSVVLMFTNFLLFIITHKGSPAMMQGEMVLQNHGDAIRILKKEEYIHLRANELRGFSGHWLAFYAIAAAILYPYKPTDGNNPDAGSDASFKNNGAI